MSVTVESVKVTTATYTVKAVALRRAYAVLKAANPNREMHAATVRMMWDASGGLVLALPATPNLHLRAVSLSGAPLAADWADYYVTRYVRVDMFERAIKGTTGDVVVQTRHDGSVAVNAATVPSVDAGPEWRVPTAVNGEFVTAASCQVSADDLRFVGSAASDSDTMPLLMGLRFDGHDVAATDRYRMHVAPIIPDGDNLLSVTVPNRIIKAVLRAKPDTVQVGHNDWPSAGSAGAATISAIGSYGEYVEVVSHPIVGNFPRWQDLMPETSDTTLVGICDREEFKRLLSVSHVAVRNMPVRFTLSSNDAQSVSTALAECGHHDEGYASAEMTYRPNVTNALTNGETVAFNPGFMSDILATLPGDGYVRWFQTAPAKPAVFRGLTDDYRTALLMPVRI